MDIFDYNKSAVVTGTRQNTIVGTQQILLAVASQADATISNCNWLLGGNTVASYDATGPAPSPVPTGNTQRVECYWIGSGVNVTTTSYPVTVTCQDQLGNNLSATATYAVNQPTITIMPSYNTTSGNPTGAMTQPSPCATPTPAPAGQWSNGTLLSNYNAVWPCGDESLNYGNPESDNFQPGISWSYNATVPSSGDGTIGMIQLKNTSRTGTTTGGLAWSSSTNTNDAWCLDTTGGNVFYNGQGLSVTPGQNVLNQQNDSPGQDLTSSGLSSITENLQYTDYFMYQPNNGIFVTLGTLSWTIDMGATQQGTGWIFSGVPTASRPTSGTISSALPTYGC